VSDFEVTEQMIKYFIDKAHKKKLISLSWPRVIIGLPSGATEVEKKAVADAAKGAGAREVFLIEETIAAAIGARLPIQEAKGNFILDIGGGTAEVAVISLGGIVCFKSLKQAGDQFNQDIIRYVQTNYKLLIGERTAEEIKISIGETLPLNEKRQGILRGRNLVTGLPEEIQINSEDIRRAMEKSLYQIIEAIKETVEITPPELLADIMEEGLYLVGGGALLKGLDKLISQVVGIKVRIIEDPLTAVVRGGGIVLENFNELKEVLTYTEDDF
ncbi:rod shape-determining protein, partial [bacterium (Candidatus Gribaldobacteria) CG_4_10_14_0_8_um_filter_33_9]